MINKSLCLHNIYLCFNNAVICNNASNCSILETSVFVCVYCI